MNNLQGLIFGEWLVLEKNGNTKDNHIKWLCKCSCGREFNVSSHDLKSGKSTKCKFCKSKTHGLCYTRIYKTYRNMLNRCFNENDCNYKDYGNRGITMCNEWRNDFMNFYNWAMQNGYNDNLEIERINNNDGYSPTNCRWATRKEQTRNTRRNKMFTLDGQTLTLTDWCIKLNINYERTRGRLRNGWKFEDAIKEVY